MIREDAPDGLRHVAVIGAGLVGSSVALACRAAGVGQVTVTDADPEVRATVERLGFADRVVPDMASAVASADLVVVAVPAAAVPDVVLEAARHAPRAAVLTDVASLKADLTLEVESRLSDEGLDATRFVGGHPMAGSERSGPDAADERLFQGATWVLTPTVSTAPATLQLLSSLLRGVGARVLALGPGRHDELVALVSHLPQVAASALADVAGEVAAEAGEVVLAVAGGGFRDTTRVAASDPQLWRGILGGNRVAVLAALARYEARLVELRHALESGDDEALEALLARSSAARRQLVPKRADLAFVDVVVALDDRPGALAVAVTALGEAGINVEDVAMRHAVMGGRGALLVRVAAADGDRALGVLAAQGLPAHAESGPS